MRKAHTIYNDASQVIDTNNKRGMALNAHQRNMDTMFCGIRRCSGCRARIIFTVRYSVGYWSLRYRNKEFQERFVYHISSKVIIDIGVSSKVIVDRKNC